MSNLEVYDKYVRFDLDSSFELAFPKDRRDDVELFNMGVEIFKEVWELK